MFVYKGKLFWTRKVANAQKPPTTLHKLHVKSIQKGRWCGGPSCELQMLINPPGKLTPGTLILQSEVHQWLLPSRMSQDSGKQLLNFKYCMLTFQYTVEIKFMLKVFYLNKGASLYLHKEKSEDFIQWHLNTPSNKICVVSLNVGETLNPLHTLDYTL